jgi:ABC-type cobalamin/Fe3+-siderophores transport system ATPase subunit
MYEADDLAVLTSPAYLERLNAPTPATRRTLVHFRRTSRAVCRVACSMGSSSGGYMLTLRLSGSREQDAALRRWIAGDAFVRAMELFEQLRLAPAVHKYPRQLSGGMRQRVSLVRTLVHDPSVLLMDEPFGALDALTRLQVRMDLEALWLRRRPTVLFITHSVEEAVGLSDRILVMSPSPGEVVDDIRVSLPRPRPIVLGDAPEFGGYVDRIHKRFASMGVLHAAGEAAQAAGESA